MQKKTLSGLYEVFINDLYDSCQKYKEGIFNSILKIYENETYWKEVDETKRKLFVFQSYMENKKIITYPYYKAIIRKFLDSLIDNDIYREDSVDFDENDIYLCYGLIAFNILAHQFYEINIEIFNLDENFSNYKKFLENNGIDINEKKSIYEKKFVIFKNLKKPQNLYKDWLNILFKKNLDSIKIHPKKKKKKIKSRPIIQITEDGLKEEIIQQDNEISTNEDEDDNKSKEINDIKNNDSNQNKIVNEESEDIIEEEEQVNTSLGKISDSDETKLKLEKEIELLKKENISINKKIDELQNMQLLFYHHISLLQNARDTSKSIYYYFYEYFVSKDKKKIFERLKEIFLKIKKEEDDNIDLQKMKKFLKFIFFLNKYNNKILHRSMSTCMEKLLNKISEKKEYPFMPGFTFKQTFDSLCFFLNKLCKDEQVQIILKKVYDEYSSDRKNLAEIFDDEKIVIVPKNGKINFLIEENEIKQIQAYLEKIKLREKNFDVLCDMTSWQIKNS